MTGPAQPIHVNFLIDGLTRAGTETQLLALIRSLDRRRVRPTLTLLDGTDPESRELLPSDCPTLVLGLKSMKRPAAVARAAKSLIGFWKSNHTDVVQTYFLDSTYLGVPLARLAGIRRVIRVRNNLGHWLTPRHRRLGRIVGRIADVTLTNSEPGRAALLEAERGDRRKLVVLENGVDFDRFAALPPPRRGQPMTIGAVGNLRHVKGIDVLVRAAAMVPGVRFVVAGDGDQRPELQQLIGRLGLADRFLLPGKTGDIPGFLAGVDVAVLPSRAEGMANALLEFMAAGRPVVATAVGANPQLLEDGRHGLLVPPDDPAALATALRQLVDDSQLADRMARSARGHVEARYSRVAMRLRFEDFYSRLCA
ncbi:MAG: glycosyltransferase [Gemmataceae bacterium]|nr:glycosyltransferase [Gemmataceae bacterium]